jgi:hypothetical protein
MDGSTHGCGSVLREASVVISFFIVCSALDGVCSTLHYSLDRSVIIHSLLVSFGFLFWRSFGLDTPLQVYMHRVLCYADWVTDGLLVRIGILAASFPLRSSPSPEALPRVVLHYAGRIAYGLLTKEKKTCFGSLVCYFLELTF